MVSYSLAVYPQEGGCERIVALCSDYILMYACEEPSFPRPSLGILHTEEGDRARYAYVE